MPTPPFQGFDPMSVYVTFSDYESRKPRNLGILLTRGERSDPPAELFQAELVGATREAGYTIMQEPKLVKKVDVRDVYARADLQLRTAVKLNEVPLYDKEFDLIRAVLEPLPIYRPGTQADWLKSIFECFCSDSSKFHYMRRVETATAQKVVELGNDLDRNRDVSECRVFKCWQEMLKEQPKPPKEQPKKSI